MTKMKTFTWNSSVALLSPTCYSYLAMIDLRETLCLFAVTDIQSVYKILLFDEWKKID